MLEATGDLLGISDSATVVTGHCYVYTFTFVCPSLKVMNNARYSGVGL